MRKTIRAGCRQSTYRIRRNDDRAPVYTHTAKAQTKAQALKRQNQNPQRKRSLKTQSRRPPPPKIKPTAQPQAQPLKRWHKGSLKTLSRSLKPKPTTQPSQPNPQRSQNPNPIPNPTRCNPTQTNRPFATGRWPPLSTSPTAGQARPSQRSLKPHQHQAKRSLKPLQANQPPPKAHPFGSLKHTNPKPSPAGQAV